MFQYAAPGIHEVVGIVLVSDGAIGMGQVHHYREPVVLNEVGRHRSHLHAGRVLFQVLAQSTSGMIQI